MNESLPLRFLQTVAVLGLCIVLTGAYNSRIVYIWYHTRDMDGICFYVKFEGVCVFWF
jgi:hypothetical protein